MSEQVPPVAGVQPPPLEPVSARSGRGTPWQTWASTVALGLSALPRIWGAIFDQGLLWPDELFQTLEPAHKWVFHLAILPWEFRQAARSWVFPGIIGLYWMLLTRLGVEHSFGLVVGAKLLMAGVSVLGIEIGRRIAVRLAGPTGGLFAVLILGACPLLLYFGYRVMTETVSGVLFLAACYLALFAERQRPALAGALASFAIFFRFQNGLLALGVLAVLAFRKDRSGSLRYAASATGVGIAGGMLDWITWSYPFQAFWSYLDFNLLSGKATEIFGANTLGYYPEHLARSMGATLGLVLFGLAWVSRRARGPVILIAVYVVAHLMIPHKEVRFLLPVVPLALALAAAGLTSACESVLPSPRWAVGLGVAMALAMGAKAAYASNLRDIGRIESGPIWHDGEDFLRMEWRVGDRPDLCGLALVGYYREWMGGYTYLHRDVPIYMDLDHLENINYVIGGKGESLPDGWDKVEEQGEIALYRRGGRCAPDADYTVPNLN